MKIFRYNKEDRFQECTFLGKMWRYRWYLLIPIKYTYYTYFKEFKTYKTEIVDDEVIHTDDYSVLTGDTLFQVLIGDAQIKMNWTYSMEDVMDKIKQKYK